MDNGIKLSMILAVCFIVMLFTTRSCILEEEAINQGVYKEYIRAIK